MCYVHLFKYHTKQRSLSTPTQCQMENEEQKLKARQLSTQPNYQHVCLLQGKLPGLAPTLQTWASDTGSVQQGALQLCTLHQHHQEQHDGLHQGQCFRKPNKTSAKKGPVRAGKWMSFQCLIYDTAGVEKWNFWSSQSYSCLVLWTGETTVRQLQLGGMQCICSYHNDLKCDLLW